MFFLFFAEKNNFVSKTLHNLVNCDKKITNDLKRTKQELESIKNIR